MNIKKDFICGLIIILLFLNFTGCMGESGIWVEKADSEPEEYINFTSEQLEEYPKLNEAVTLLNSENYDKTYAAVKCNQKEEEEIHNLFGGFYGKNFFDLYLTGVNPV